jgi:pimeloyl-ACP methyl ester carboxylesterase
VPFLKTDDVSLYFSVQGEGVPIVFIHPPVLTSKNFKYQVEELSKHFQVITFDIRGHGKSGFSKVPLTYPIIVEDIKRLLDHLHIHKAFLCGYSTGGSIVLEFSLKNSDRVLGGIVVSGMSEVRIGTLKDKLSLGKSLAAQDAVPIIALSVSKTNSQNKEMFRELFSSCLQTNARNAEQYYHSSLEYNCTDLLDNIDTPILLVYGKKDKQFHPYAKLLQKKLRHSELIFVKQVKHQIPTKAYKELNQLIKEFIL